MTPELAHPPLSAAPLRRRYRQFVSLPAGARWGGGFVGALAAAAVAGVAQLPPAAGLLAWLLAVATVTDLMWRRIFNCLLGPALAAVAVLHAAGALGLHTGLPAPAPSAAGLGLCFALMLVLHLTFRGGEGDVKMVAVLGAVLGWWHGVEAAMIGYLLAAAVAVVLVVARLAHRAAARAPGGPHPALGGTLPMAPFFAAGTVLTLL